MADAPMYAIYNDANLDEAWSNEHGWVDTPTFDLFTEADKASVALPIDGIWRRVAP